MKTSEVYCKVSAFEHRKTDFRSPFAENLTSLSLHVKLVCSVHENSPVPPACFAIDRRADQPAAGDHLAPGRGCFTRRDHDHRHDGYRKLPLRPAGFYVRFQPGRKLVHPPNRFSARAFFCPRHLEHCLHQRRRLHIAIASQSDRRHFSGGDRASQSAKRHAHFNTNSRTGNCHT